LDAVLTDNGVARYTAAELISNPGLGSFTGTFVRNGILFGKTGRDITPLFSLKKSVTINAHRYMAAALAAVKPQVEERLETALSEVMKKE